MSRYPDAAELSAQLINRAGLTHPPTDLEAISSLWPDLRVSEDDLDKEGYLVFLGARRGELILRRNDPPNRKRFTFAHELGHWVLSHTQNGSLGFDGPATLSPSTHRTRQTPEETWCNDFAAQLLMPTAEIHRYLDGNPSAVPTKLTNGHFAFSVSEETFLARVCDEMGWIVVHLSHGRNLHRIGKQFMRRGEDRNISGVAIDTLLEQTRKMEGFGSEPISLPGFNAYGTLKSASRDTSRYLVCLMPEESYTHADASWTEDG